MPTVRPMSPHLVERLVAKTISSARRVPAPLVSVSHAIDIRGHLAAVTVTRTFQNAEVDTIEAALTFPVPVSASLMALEATICGRRLKGLAQPRNRARETYEDALDAGQTAVLHEELTKGVHLLSVGHVPPGEKIDVTTVMAVPMTAIGNRTILRLPMTVGDIYGKSGLEDSDDLTTGGVALASDVEVKANGAHAVLVNGMPAAEGRRRVWIDRPLVVEVLGAQPTRLFGTTCAGQHVEVELRPEPIQDEQIAATVLLDTSGSMAEGSGTVDRQSKLAAAISGLRDAGSRLRTSDRLELWTFSNEAHACGCTPDKTWTSCLDAIAGPNGGTEIGHALSTVLDTRSTTDILLITDGKSHALDVHALARRGARITVVLVGEDSLEANVGHLAILTGGDIYAIDGADITQAVSQALASLRSPSTRLKLKAAVGDGRQISTVRGGMRITAIWTDRRPAGELFPAATAFATSLALATFGEEAATELAVAEGLVSHLTSLVLVDEAGSRQVGLPLLRKVDLPAPPMVRAIAPAMHFECLADSSRLPASSGPELPCASPRRPGMLEAMRERLWPTSTAGKPGKPTTAEGNRNQPRKCASAIDWADQARRLADGDLTGLPPDLAEAIDAFADRPDVQRAADRFGLSPRDFVIALLARLVAGRNRPASRVARTLIGRADKREVAAMARSLGF